MLISTQKEQFKKNSDDFVNFNTDTGNCKKFCDDFGDFNTDAVNCKTSW